MPQPPRPPKTDASPVPLDARRSPSSPSELWRVTRGAFAEVGALAFPVPCVGCGEPPSMLCATCQRELRPAVNVRVLPSGLRVWSGLSFEGTAAGAIRALKAELRTPLARALAPALASALDAAWRESASARDGRTRIVVPVPTSAASWRLRGVRIVELLAQRAGAAPVRALRPVRRIADQRGLDRAGREHNVAGSMRCAQLAGVGVLLLDDVVTTGATLDEASRAVAAAGGRVLGAVALASTPRVSGGSGMDA